MYSNAEKWVDPFISTYVDAFQLQMDPLNVPGECFLAGEEILALLALELRGSEGVAGLLIIK